MGPESGRLTRGVGSSAGLVSRERTALSVWSGAASGVPRPGGRTLLAAFLLMAGAGAFSGVSAEAPAHGLVQEPPADTIEPQEPAAADTIDPEQWRDPQAEPPYLHGLARLVPSLEDIPGIDAEMVARAAERVAREPDPFPQLPEAAPGDARTGVWEWDREALLAVRALTLEELLRQVPGVTTLRTGDYGNPSAATAFGLEGGRVRVLMDGVELAPMESGVVDLAQVPLAGLDRVRVERHLGELRVELQTLEITEPDPYTFVQAGTGDLSTDFFRGAFAHPQALGGQVTFGLERLATRGTGREEPGTQLGMGIRYSVHPWEGGSLSAEFRRGSVDRYEGIFEAMDGLQTGLNELSRTDWIVRGRHELTEGAVAEVFAGTVSFGGWDEEELGLDEEDGGARALSELQRRQVGARFGVEGDWYWGRAGVRRQTGDGWPSSRMELEVGARSRLGGADVTVEREGWRRAGDAVTARGRAWTERVYGVSLFAQVEDGRRGVPFVPDPPPPDDPEDPDEDNDEDEENDGAFAAGTSAGEVAPQPEPDEEEPETSRVPRFTERTGLRVGGEFARGALTVSAAYLHVDADSLHPLGLPPEGDAVVPAGATSGLEVSGSVPLPVMDGLGLQGTYTEWVDGPLFRYMPSRSWSARLTYHNVFLETRNLELWTDVGAHGRDAMEVPAPGVGNEELLEPVPSALEWSFRLQVRVQSVRAFVHWENLTVRTDNEDFPGRALPGGRAAWGIRWTMWN